MEKKQYDMEQMKKVVNNIQIKPQMQEEIIRNLESMKKQRRHNRYGYKKMIATAACLMLVIGVAVPVSAKVYSLVKERMEQVPEEEINTMVRDLDKQSTDANTCSRKFTEKESALLVDLEKHYNQGKFPKAEIKQIDNMSQLDEEKICYLTTDGSYYFPEREMTEEELLEYIDFQHKLEYGLDQRNQEMFAEENKEKEEAEKNSISKIVSAGGVNEEQAINVAAQWMDTLYPGMRNGMDQKSYLFDDDTREPLEAITSKYKNVYMVYYGVIGDGYYFYIDADTGILVAFDHGQIADAVTETEAKEAIQNHLSDAKEKIKNTFGLQEYESVFASYETEESKKDTVQSIDYHFVTKDGSDVILTYMIKTGEICRYRDTIYVDQSEGQKEVGVKINRHIVNLR